MNEALGIPAPPDSDSTPGVDTPGALLKRERERRALSVEQAAEDLHLDPWIIEAIEANRFHALGAPVYAKGHLRKYATQLALPVDDIVARYDSLHDRPVVTDPIPAAMVAPVPAPRRSYKGILMTGAGLVVIAALTWVGIKFVAPALNRNSTTPTAVSAPSAPTPAAAPAASETLSVSNSVLPAAIEPTQTPAPAMQSDARENATTSVLNSTTPRPVEIPVEAQVSQSAVPAAAAEGALQVRLRFSGDSWTEVYDAQGARLMFAMGTAGRTRVISGVPPLQFTVGSVSAVTLEVNGEPVVIPRRDGRESARFVIEADGNLR